MNKLFTLAVMMLASASFAFCGTNTPEIDASTGIGAITLVSGGLLILRSRRKK